MYTLSLSGPRNTIARKPSHFGSNRKSPSRGSPSVSLASMGSIGGVTAKVAGRGILKSRSLEPPRAIGLERLMKIAQVAPLYESVPPKYYGGTERVVSYLTEELVRLGHDVTLFASGDSETAARLVPVAHRSLRLDQAVKDPLAPLALMLERVRAQAHEFDILHFHLQHVHLPVFRPLARRTVTT